ncbi:hypothetical protein PC1_032 [Pseudomonas phage PC1]
MNYKKPSAAYTGTRSRAAQNRKKSHEDLLREARCDSSLKSIAFGAMRGTLTRLCDLGSLIAPLGFVALLVGGVLWAFWDATGLPTVYESYMTQECVRVELMDGTPGDCSNLPDRYHHVWVE